MYQVMRLKWTSWAGPRPQCRHQGHPYYQPCWKYNHPAGWQSYGMQGFGSNPLRWGGSNQLWRDQCNPNGCQAVCWRYVLQFLHRHTTLKSLFDSSSKSSPDAPRQAVQGWSWCWVLHRFQHHTWCKSYYWRMVSDYRFGYWSHFENFDH